MSSSSRIGSSTWGFGEPARTDWFDPGCLTSRNRSFTVFWVFPVTLFVTLVSIQNISSFWPGLVSLPLQFRLALPFLTVPSQKAYLDKHPWEEELIQSFVPTLLVSLLSLLIPLLLRKLLLASLIRVSCN